mgnify:CR=1 FL=1
MSKIIKIRLAARCEAAGRPENEDNFQVAENLSVSNTGFTTDKIFSLDTKGTLLLVCDGMGGMNAGEVASAIAVETIKNLFAPQLLTDEILANDDSICTYMKNTIIKADHKIKDEASKDEAKYGMGSTAVMAWLIGNKVYVAWCGDSRCYRYNSTTGLEQLSHDHSYVQDLVDSGQLSADLAFDHPNKNIITRSLGTPHGSARPDAKVYDLHAGDVILLCSDGLSDSLRDNEIEQSINRSLTSMAECRDALWHDSKQAGWHDNVTIVLAQIIENDNVKQADPQPQAQSSKVTTETSEQKTEQKESTITTSKTTRKPSIGTTKKKKNLIITIISIFVCLCVLGFIGNQKEQRQKEQYNQLYDKLDKIDICRINNSQINDSLSRIIEQLDRLEKLEEKINDDEYKKCANLKTKINLSIADKCAILENESDGNKELANEIRKNRIIK